MKFYCNEETCPNRIKGCAFCTVLMDIKDCPKRKESKQLVKVIKLGAADENTNISMGDIGVIEKISGSGNVINVDFGDLFQVSGSNPNCNYDGTYQMWKNQLEFIEPEEL